MQEQIGRYEIKRRLGRGGMATVFAVRHTVLQSLHALKVLHITAPKVRERMRREGKLQASLRHPNIVTVTDIVTVIEFPETT